MSLRELGLVVVAAGSSSRMGEIDKVWAELSGEPLLLASLRALAPVCGSVVVVARDGDLDRVRRAVAPLDLPPLTVVAGGADRQDSVYRGLRALGDMRLTAVHDCARPFAEARLLDDAVGLLHDCDGAVPAVPLTDTVKLVDGDGVVCATPPRASLRAIQTPQVFRTAELCRAHEDARRHGVRGTDDATLIEALGLRVRVFPGDPRNFKITTPLDLLAARAMVAEGQPTS